VERIKRLQAARDRTVQPGAPTACTGPGPQAEILPTTIPHTQQKGRGKRSSRSTGANDRADRPSNNTNESPGDVSAVRALATGAVRARANHTGQYRPQPPPQ
jgi:hypothetical protein